MMESRNIDLLNHPLAAKLRDAKWRKYGQYFYYVNLCIYLAFVVALTVYIIYAEDIYVFYTFEREPIKGLDWASSGRLPTTSAATLKPTFELNSKSAPVNATLPPYRTDANLAALVEFLGVFAWINLTKEIFQLYNQGMHYFKSFSNYIDLAIYLSLMATGFITVADITYTLYSVIIFLAYVNLLLAMERLDFIGVYVHMLQSVLATVVNTLGIVVILSMGFALSFTILNPRQATFYSLPLAFIKVLNMMIGEMDYDGTWFDNIKSGEIVMPESVVSLLMIGVFIFIMPVIVMNLMVGLAVGDIDKVRREADLRMLSSRLEYLDNLERTFPFRFKHYFYIGFQTEYITKDLENMSDEEFNSSWKDSGILDTTKDHEDPKKEKDKLTVVSDQLKDQEQRIDSLTKNISILSDRMNALHETVGKQFESLQDEIKKMIQSNSLHSLPRVE